MKQFSLLLSVCLFVTFNSFSQGKKIVTDDPLVAEMEASQKTPAPFSIRFKEQAFLKTSEVQSLFTKYLGKKNEDELSLKSHDASQEMVVDRFQQYFKGIIVEHGNYITNSREGSVILMTGDFFKIDPSTSVIPVLSEKTALQKAWLHVDGMVPSDDDTPPGSLVFIEDGLQPDNTNGTQHLAYKFLISSRKTELKIANIYVDAITGHILSSELIVNSGCYKPSGKTTIPSSLGNVNFSNVSKKTDLSIFSPFTVSPLAATIYSGTRTNMVTRQVGGIGAFRLESVRPPTSTDSFPNHTKNVNHAALGTTAQISAAVAASTEITDADNNWTLVEYDNANRDNTAFDVHWGTQRVYDYWKTRHLRRSWNGSDGVLNCYVHGQTNWDNAFWTGSVNSMFYGDGSNVNGGFSTLSALDVTGHEIGHGVCQSTSNLTYSKESGGMNEGFSDIWGAAIEHFGDPFEGDAVPKRYFDIGEEIGLPLPNNPLRSMSIPKSHGQPDTYLGVNWVSTTTATDVGGDNWGVHTNSGVLNHWFYLMVMGGSGTNDNNSVFSVPAIDWVNAERIAYATEINLAPASTYANARTVSIQQATNLPGNNNNPCSLLVEAVTRAWYAVGVGADFVPCSPQISFVGNSTVVTELAGTNCATRSKTISIPFKISSAATGGTADPVITVAVTGGNAVAGTDYVLGSTTVTFPRGTTTNQNLTVTINDDGNIEANDTIQIALQSVNANGSNATKANVGLIHTVIIVNDDKAEDLGGPETHQVGVYSINQNNTSPFRSSVASSRTQYIMSVADLKAAGVRPNVPITNMSVFVAAKKSSQPYNGYTISLGNTTAVNVATAWVPTALTQVYTGNYNTIPGVNSFALTSTFQWDGTSNLAIQVCFANATAGTLNDSTYGYTGSLANGTNFAAGGCGAAFAAANSVYIPLYTFTQAVPPTTIATVFNDTRQWNMDETGSTDNFYTAAPNGLIAKVKSNDVALGCVTATVTGAGTTFPALPAPFTGRNRSAKEITITPTTNGASANYNGTIYLTTAELAGKVPASLQLVKTNAATDAAMTTANTSVVTVPVILAGTNYKGFSGNFKGFSRFFLVDGPLALPEPPYTFTGTGNWDVAGNWANNAIPPSTLPSGGQIIINHTVGGICILNVTQTISAGATLTINSGKNLKILGNLQ